MLHTVSLAMCIAIIKCWECPKQRLERRVRRARGHAAVGKSGAVSGHSGMAALNHAHRPPWGQGSHTVIQPQEPEVVREMLESMKSRWLR